jgi:RimJ/RimL family protein N-acetyltransferase
MKLLSLDSTELIERVAGWLAEKENYQGLDFGGGRPPTPALLKIMTQRDTNVLRAFTADDDTDVIGVVGLSAVDRQNKTAMVWAVLGDKSRAARGLTARAVSRLLTFGFRELGLRAIGSWTVEHNVAGLEITKRLNFKFIGRQRQCHSIDGRSYDRLLFDLLAAEHKEI